MALPYQKLKTININDKGFRKTVNIKNLNNKKEKKIIFLGGSIINHGGQNPIEPARMGCSIYHGPHVNNFKEVYSYLYSYNISKKISTINNLKRFLLKDLRSKGKRRKDLQKRINFLGQSILKNIYLEIKNLL